MLIDQLPAPERAPETGRSDEILQPPDRSAAYHTFRFWFGWEPVRGRALGAGYELDDLRGGRTGPCALCTWETETVRRRRASRRVRR